MVIRTENNTSSEESEIAHLYEQLPDVAVQSNQSASTTEIKKGKGTQIKTSYIVIASFIALVLLVIGLNNRPITKDNVESNALYNTELGVGVKAGASISSTNKKLGDPTPSYDRYVYPGYLNATYADGKISSLEVEYPNERWITKGGITIDSSEDDVLAVYGGPSQKENNDQNWYYYCDSCRVGFAIIDHKVKAILIQYNS